MGMHPKGFAHGRLLQHNPKPNIHPQSPDAHFDHFSVRIGADVPVSEGQKRPPFPSNISAPRRSKAKACPTGIDVVHQRTSSVKVQKVGLTQQEKRAAMDALALDDTKKVDVEMLRTKPDPHLMVLAR